MPELAEVEFYRKRWHRAAIGEQVARVLTHDSKRVLREIDSAAFRRALVGATLVASEARAKQIAFRFRRPGSRVVDVWLGIHLGMSGELIVARSDYVPGKHDHLVLVTGHAQRTREIRSSPSTNGPFRPSPSAHTLVFYDPRMFGRVQFHVGAMPPAWWTRIPPAILSNKFTVRAVSDFLRRRRRAPIKAVLLMQERFPGIGNWMADEILWRAGIHPARAAGSLGSRETRTLWRECRRVCRLALATIAGKGGRLPPDLNVHIPPTWLFTHRWRRGGKDPIDGTPLKHSVIGGRTTCWSPARQKLH